MFTVIPGFGQGTQSVVKNAHHIHYSLVSGSVVVLIPGSRFPGFPVPCVPSSLVSCVRFPVSGFPVSCPGFPGFCVRIPWFLCPGFWIPCPCVLVPVLVRFPVSWFRVRVCAGSLFPVSGFPLSYVRFPGSCVRVPVSVFLSGFFSPCPGVRSLLDGLLL